MLKRIIDAFKWMLLAAALAVFLFRMVFYDLFITISSVILQPFFEDRWHLQWNFIVIVPLTVLFFSLISVISWRIRKINNDAEKRAYLHTLADARYDRAAEKAQLKTDKGFHAELIAYAVIAVLQSAFTFNWLFALLTAPLLFLVFYLTDKKLWLDLRETWAANRLRLNPDAPNPENPSNPSNPS